MHYPDIASTAATGGSRSLSAASIALILHALSTLGRDYWTDENGEPVEDADWDTIDAAIARAMDEIVE